MVVKNAYLPQPQFRPTSKGMERTMSTNVAVNGVSMPTSDGRVHRHGPLLKDQSPSSGKQRHHRGDGPSERHRARPKSRSSSRGRPRTTQPTKTAAAADEAAPAEERRSETPSRRSKSQTRQPELQQQQQQQQQQQPKQQHSHEETAAAARSGAGTLDAFMQQKLEQKHVSLKQLGASLRRLQRDEGRDDDGLTHVAVSHEENPPSENDRSTGNRKASKKKNSSRTKESKRLERKEKAAAQAKAVKAVAGAGSAKTKSLTVVTDTRTKSGELGVDEALRLFEQKYKLSAPDADGTSHEAQAGIVPEVSERMRRDTAEEIVHAVASSPSLNVTRKSVSTPSTNERPPSIANGHLLPTIEPARHGAGAVVPATSSLSAGNNGTTTILRCLGSGDDQRSTGASTTIRSLDHKGRRYKEVITVVSKSDDSNGNGSVAREGSVDPAAVGDAQQPVLNTRIIIEDLRKSPKIKPVTLSEKVDKEKGVMKNESVEKSGLNEKRSVVKPAPLPKSQTGEDSETKQVAHPPTQALALTTVEDMLGGQESPTYQGVLSNFQDTPTRSAAKGGWLGFGRMITPRWLPRRLSAGTPKTPEMHGKVTPLIAITHRLRSSPKVDRNGTTQSHISETLAPKPETAENPQEEKGAAKAAKKEDEVDDDASSLFNFHSPNSSEKELGDIFSFISSRRGSRDVNEGKCLPPTAVHHDSIPVASPRRGDIDKKATTRSPDVVPVDVVAPSVSTAVQAGELLHEVDALEPANEISMPSKQRTKNSTRLRVVTARTRKDHFLSFLSTKYRPNDGKAASRMSGIKGALLPLLRKEGLKQEVREITDESEHEVTQSKEAVPPSVVENNDVVEADALVSNQELPVLDDDGTRHVSDPPVSPTGAISQDLTQSTSMESNSTGGMFGISAFLTSMCGPDKKCEVKEPLPWRDCGPTDDDHSLVDDETESQPNHRDERLCMPLAKPLSPRTDNSIIEESIGTSSEHDATASPKTTDGVEAIETVLHNNRECDPLEVSPMRRVLSTGNLSVANGSLFNVRITLRYLKGLYASFNKGTSSLESNRSVVTGFVRVSQCSALASCSLDAARSRPVNLMSLCDKAGPLPPVVWSSKRVLDRRRGRLYFSVVLKQLYSGGVPVAFSRERVRLVFGLQQGDETIEIGSTSFEVNGTELTQKRVELPLQSDVCVAKKTQFLGPRRRTSNQNSFSGNRHDYSLLAGSVLSTKIDVKVGDHDLAGPLVWEDCIVADDESFDDSYVPSLCEQASQAEPYDSVEVVPLPRGAAIISKGGYVEGRARTPGRASPANESLSSLRKNGERGVQNNRRRIPNLFARKKPTKAQKTLPSAVTTPIVKEASLDSATIAEPVIASDLPEEETASLLSPMSDSHSDCSFSAVASNDDDTSAGESSSVSSKKRATLTDKAADWVYRGARAAGFFSYSSDEEKMTQFSFGTKDDTHNYPTSDLSDSVMTDEASEVVIEQLKYWIQNETSTSQAGEQAQGGASTPRTNTESRTSLTEILRSKLDEREGNPQQSLEHFKKILLLAQRLNLSPYDLIRRLENGENIEDLLHSK